MADTYYQSQHEGSVIDEQITYVKDTVKKTIPDHQARIIEIENSMAKKDEIVKYTEKNQANGYAGLNENCKIPSELLDGKLVLDGDKEKWDSHLEDMNAHEELLKKERETFNHLYANALLGSAEGSSITIEDANPGLPVEVTLYGQCTETLENPDAEKSPDNPAAITGIGESGSVTVTVNIGEDIKNIVIPLEKPIYGIKHPTTGEWLVRDEIRVENGKVLLIKNIEKKQMTENAVSIIVDKASVNFVVFNIIIDWSMQSEIYKSPLPSDKYRFAVLSTLLKAGANPGTTLAEDLAIGYIGNYVSQIGMKFMNTTLGITSESTAEEIKSAFKTWVSNYNSTHDVKFDVYYKLNSPKITDITDTEAGQAILSLVSQNGSTYTNSENADMKITYNRDINKAFEELQNAITTMNIAMINNI